MCGLYEPPRGREQEGHSQLCNRISQNFRGVTNTDSSEGKTHTWTQLITLYTLSYIFLEKYNSPFLQLIQGEVVETYRHGTEHL